MSVIDSVLGQQIDKSLDDQQVQSEPEVISIPSGDLSELESNIESMPTKELEGEETEVLQPQPTVLNSESERPIYQAASPPPPSPYSVITSVEPPASRDLCEVSSGGIVPPIVMGCSHCFYYALVSTANLKCPKCGLCDLVDVVKLLPL